MIADLRAYCERDTMAMVALHHHLNRLCMEPDGSGALNNQEV